MSQRSAANTFDFKSSPVFPYYEHLPAIALRARAILHSRTATEIKAAVDIITMMFEDSYRDEAGYELDVEASRNMPEVRRYTIGESLQSPSSESLAKETSKDTFHSLYLETDIKYLKKNINSFTFDDSGFKNPTQEELLSAYSLSCIAECHAHLDPLQIFTTVKSDNKFPADFDPRAIASAIRTAGKFAILATEAVCQAEHILDMRKTYEEAEIMIHESPNAWDGLRKLLKVTPGTIEELSRKKVASRGGHGRMTKKFPEREAAREFLRNNFGSFDSFADAERKITDTLNLQDRDTRTMKRWLRPVWNELTNNRPHTKQAA